MDTNPNDNKNDLENTPGAPPLASPSSSPESTTQAPQMAPEAPPSGPDYGPAPLEGASPAQPQASAYTVSPPPKRSKSWLKWLVLLVLLIGLGAGAYLAVKQVSKPVATSSNAPADVKKDVPLIRFSVDDGSVGTLFPKNIISDTSNTVNAQIFEGLVKYQDATKIVPALATGWSNPDSSTWVFDLKQNVKFHTGKTMTAQDVKYSLEYVQKNNEELAGSFASTIKSVEVVNDNQVKITTDGPDPTLLNKLSFLYILDSKATPGDAVAGTGAYKVKDGTTPDDKQIDLVAYDDYHGGHVFTRELQIKTMPVKEQIEAYKRGELDIAGVLSQEEINSFQDRQDHKTVTYGVFFLGLNTLKAGSPLNTVKGREALRIAIDIPTLLKNSQTEGVPASQLIPETIPGYNKDVPLAPHDTAKAKQLLTEAGVKPGTKINFLHGANRAKFAGELSRQLSEVGLVLVPQEEPDFGKFFDIALGGKTDMYLASYGSDILDSSDTFKVVIQQGGNYKNPKLDELLDQSDKTIDPSARLKLLQEISKLTIDDVAAIPLVTVPQHWALRQPYVLKQDMQTAQIGAYFWQVYTE